MGSTYLHLESGLVAVQQGGDWAAIQAALKRHDRNLELGAVPDPRFGGKPCWKVYYRHGGESQQVQFLCDWRDPDGTPRELSSGLVDKVMVQDRNTRERLPSAEELERKRVADLAEHREEQMAALADDWLDADGNPRNLRKTVRLDEKKGSRGNSRWKAEQFELQKRRRARGYDH